MVRSIRHKLFRYIVPLVVVPVVLTVALVLTRSTRILYSKAEESAYNNIAQVRVNLDDVFGSGDSLFSALTLNQSLSTLLARQTDIDRATDFRAASRLIGQLQLLTKSYANIDSIYVYDLSDDLLLLSEGSALIESGIRNWSAYRNLAEGEKFGRWVRAAREQGASWKNNEVLITCAYPLKRLTQRKIQGYLFINVNEREVRSYIDRMAFENAAGMFVTDEDGTLIACADETLFEACRAQGVIGRLISEGYEERASAALTGGAVRIYMEHSSSTGMRYFAAVPVEKLSREVNNLFYIALWIGLPVVLASLMLSVGVSRFLYRPVRKLVDAMDSLDVSSSMIPLIGERRNDEFGLLYTSFNQMAVNNNALTTSIVEEQIKKKEAELRLLQEQINPHFLYNTINSMYYLAKLHGDDQLADLTFSVGNFFRISLSGGQALIPVCRMLEQLEHYVRIQNARFSGRFRLTVDVDESLYALMVPKLLLQPLVENAIMHGLKDVPSPAPVEVAGYYLPDRRVCFTVTDHGAGIAEEKLLEILRSLNDPGYDSEDLFALKNLRQRLELNYAGSATLRIFSQEGKGTVVEMILPNLAVEEA